MGCIHATLIYGFNLAHFTSHFNINTNRIAMVIKSGTICVWSYVHGATWSVDVFLRPKAADWQILGYGSECGLTIKLGKIIWFSNGI